MARELAVAVGSTGRVYAIDLSEAMLALARHRCADLPWIEPVMGDITALDLPGNRLDGVVAMQSLAYVPEVERALAEIARVLRPGGRAVVLDTDFGSLVWHGRDQGRVNQIFAAYNAHVAHPMLPRVLGPLAEKAGLLTLRREVVPIFDVSFNLNTFAHGIASFVYDFVVGSGLIPEVIAKGWLQECAELDREGAFFMSLNRYLFVVARPAPYSEQ